MAFLAPHECIGCGSEGSLLCDTCAYDGLEAVPSRCYRCLRLTRDYRVCEKCRPSVRLRHVWVASGYRSYAKQLVRLLKYERAKAAAETIAVQLTETVPYLSPDVLMAHLPTATSRQRQRGYDQAELIARLLAERTDARHTHLLERLGQTRQVGSTRKQRFSQAETMFRLRKGVNVRGASILLVDDILTTGASLEAAAGLLKKAGAKEVNAVVFAQKQ